MFEKYIKFQIPKILQNGRPVKCSNSLHPSLSLQSQNKEKPFVVPEVHKSDRLVNRDKIFRYKTMKKIHPFKKIASKSFARGAKI